MAQTRLGQTQVAGSGSLTESQRREIQQYENIVRFQEAILSGKHPEIDVPPSLLTSTHSSVPITHAPLSSAPKTHKQENSHSFSANAQRPSVANGSFSNTVTANGTATAGARPYGMGSTEINPILLEKSEDLVKAELQLQRQRLERALKEDVEHRRVASKNSNQAEPLADFDLSDVLSKALTLVQATAAPLQVAENVSAANNDAASDSFDDDTFYSSQHNTPEPLLSSRARHESNDAQPVEPSKPHTEPPESWDGVQRQDFRPDNQSGNLASQSPRVYKGLVDSSKNAVSYAPTSVAKPPVRNEPLQGVIASSGPSQNTSGAPSQSEDSANMDIEHQGPAHPRHRPHHYNDSYNDSRPLSPLLRGHDLSPYAPRPSHISQLAVSGRLVPSADQLPHSSTGTPAQVMALRHKPNAATSPESSPQNGKVSDKKKGKKKKKKRKADKQAPESDATPYIKPEPCSPSPIAAPAFSRPSKRQRVAPRQPDEPGFGTTMHNPNPVRVQVEPYSDLPRREARVPVGYDRTEAYPQQPANAAFVGNPTVYGREYIDERRIAGDSFAPPPNAYAVEYQGGATQPAAPVGTSRIDDGYRESPRAYREAFEAGRLSVRPENEAFMRPPPRPQATRILVDAYGREYYEPARPAVVRHSAAPPIRHGEPEVIYERAAPRAYSRHAGAEVYEEGGVIYRRPSPVYPVQRRVVTQPEYYSHEYGGAQHREYSARPVAPSGDYVEVAAPAQRRHAEDVSREYVARAASIRPNDPVRYEIPHEYGSVQNVRPEAPIRQYAPNVHPESQREPYIRDYGAPTVRETTIRPERSVRPAERYYEETLRGGEEIAFIERPRGAAQEIVYVDDARQEVYR